MTCCFRAWSASFVHWRKEVACYRYRNMTGGYREEKMSCRTSEGKEGQ